MSVKNGKVPHINLKKCCFKIEKEKETERERSLAGICINDSDPS